MESDSIYDIIYTFFLPILLTIFGFLLRFYRIDKESIWLDESYSFHFSRRSFNYLVTELSFSVPHSPFYHIVLKIWTKIFGTSELSLRFPSLVFGTLCIPIIYLLATELFDRRVGTVAMFLSSINYYQIYYSQEARMYTMMIFFGLLSIYFSIRFVRYSGRKNIVLYILSTILLGYTHAHAFFIITVQNIFVICILIYSLKIKGSYYHNGSVRSISKKWIISQILIFITLIPWIYVLIVKALNESSAPWLYIPNYMNLVFSYTRHFGFGPESGGVLILILIVLFVSTGIFTKLTVESDSFLGFDREHAESILLLVILATIPVLFPFIISNLIAPIYYSRYVVIVSISIIILMSKSIVSLVQNDAFSLIIIFVLIIFTMMPVATYYENHTKSQWSETVDYVESDISEDDLLISMPKFTQHAYNYYSENESYEAHFTSDKTSINSSNTEGDIYLVWNTQHWNNSPPPDLISSIEETHKLVEESNYVTTSVRVYERKPVKS